MAGDEQQPEQIGIPGVGLGGPFLTTAVICERVLREADGVLSIIRMVDRITVTAQGQPAPAQMPVVPINLTALVCLKLGSREAPTS